MFNIKQLASLVSMTVAFLCSCHALAISSGLGPLEDNAPRIAPRMPPLNPKRVFNPARLARPRAQSSSAAQVVVCIVGRIRVDKWDERGENDGELGWLNDVGIIVPDPANATVFQLNDNGFSTPGRMKMHNDNTLTMSLTSSRSTGTLNPLSSEYAVPFFSDSIYAPRSEMVDPNTGKTYMRETPMWRVAASNGRVYPIWTNEAGDQFGTWELGTFVNDNKLYFSGAPLKSMQSSGDFGNSSDSIFVSIHFEIVPESTCDA